MRKNKTTKIVIDTNLWISFIISKKFIILDELLFDNNVRLLFSEELLEEIETTITKPRLRKYFSNRNALSEMLKTFHPYIDFVEVNSNIDVCRDKADNFLLALCKDGSADFY